MLKALVSDFDGTLVDSLPTTYTFYKDLCYEHGKEYSVNLGGKRVELKSPADLKRVFKEPISEVYEALGFNWQRDKQAILRDFEVYMCENIPPLFSGVSEVLEGLKKKGVKIGLVTSLNFTSIVKARLSKYRIANMFDEIIVHDFTMRPKPAPDYVIKCLTGMDADPEESGYVGDLPSDVKAGRAAGTRTIAVSYGFGVLEKLIEAKPDYLARNVPMLKAVLDL